MVWYREVPEEKLSRRKRELAARALAYARANLLLGPIDLVWFEECTREEAEALLLEDTSGQ